MTNSLFFPFFLSCVQEFKEGRRGSGTAPQVLFSHAEPPKELQGTDALTGDNVGYITFGENAYCWSGCGCVLSGRHGQLVE